MTGYTIVLFASLAAAGLFVAVGIYSSRRVLSPSHFFHREEESSNVVSLSVANVTLGTGLVFLVTGAQQHGMPMLLVPVATLIGYLLLARTATKLGHSDSASKARNLLAAVQDELNKINPADRIPVASSLTTCLVIVYSLVLGYELVASPQILAPFVTATPTLAVEVYLSVVLFIAALLTVLFGGIRGVFNTDWLQMGAIVALLGVMLWVSTDHSAALQEDQAQAALPDTPISASIVAVLMACAAAIATQYYSLLNWATASHVQPDQRASVFRRVGLLTALLLAVMVVAGLASRASGQNLMALMGSAFARVSDSGGLAMWVTGILVAIGVTSVVCSTVDSLMLTVTQFYYDNIAGMNSRDAVANPKLLVKIRLTMAGAFAAGFATMAMLFYLRADLFTTLLTLATGVAVFAPFIWLLAVLLKTPNGLCVIRRWVLWTYIGLFVVSYLVALYLLGSRPDLVAYVGITGLSVSLVYTAWLYSGRNSQIKPTMEKTVG